MTKYNKPVFIVLMHFLFLQGIFSQGQVNIAEYLKQRFVKYCEEVPREEIFVHSDREDYIAGEDMWFNIYLIDRQSNNTLTTDNIAYFELLNQENRAIIQKNIYLSKGFGPGQIVLPDTLSSGTYTIRAYTSWMKNFLPGNCFMKEIKVYNVFSKKAFQDKVYSNSIINENRVSKYYNSGLTLKVNDSDPEIFEIFVIANEAVRKDNENTFYLFIQTHGIINHVSTEKVLSENTKISIPKRELIPGINHITVFNAKGQPLRERFIYTPDPDDQSVTVSSSGILSRRSKISLNIEIGDLPDDILNSGNLSISVIPESIFQTGTGIDDYMIFGSEFNNIPMNTFGGRKMVDYSSDFIDSILLNVESNWINWVDILSGEFSSFKYKPEVEEHFLSGRLISRNSLIAESGKVIIMSTPGKDALFQYAITNDNGSFSLSIPIDDYYKDLIIQPADGSTNYNIRLESPFSDKYFSSEIISVPEKDSVNPYISKMSVNYQVSKIYETSSISDSSNHIFPEIKIKRFYGEPDIELVMEDYIKLPVMEEVFFELIPGAFLKNKKSGYEISMSDPLDNQFYEIPPGLMVDGVLINDPSIIADMDPEIVEKIDVIRERYFVGNYLFYGIINVITKDGDFSAVSLPDYSTRLQYRAIDHSNSYVTPDYTSKDMKDSRIPDFRNTIYWNPSLIPDENGKVSVKFWSPDILGIYLINIQGVTSSGKFVSYKKTIEVE